MDFNRFLGLGLIGIGLGYGQICFGVFVRCIQYIRFLVGRAASIIVDHVMELVQIQCSLRSDMILNIKRGTDDLSVLDFKCTLHNTTLGISVKMMTKMDHNMVSKMMKTAIIRKKTAIISVKTIEMKQRFVIIVVMERSAMVRGT